MALVEKAQAVLIWMPGLNNYKFIFRKINLIVPIFLHGQLQNKVYLK